MNVQFSDLTPEGKRYFAELKKFAKLEIQVGFQAGQASEEDGTDIVHIAAYNEFGTSRGIPKRPFMKQSFENHRDEIQKICDAALASLKKGGTAEEVLNQVGVFCEGLIKQEIVDGKFTPNDPYTIELKLHRDDPKQQKSGDKKAEQSKSSKKLKRKKVRKKKSKKKQAQEKSSEETDTKDCTPLIDTATMRQSVSYVIKRRK